MQWLLRRPISWMAKKLSSSPKQKAVYESLVSLLKNINAGNGDYGPVISFALDTSKFIIFSDQHKGGKDLADDFRNAEDNYIAALRYYYNNGFTYINLGDSEELWENTPATVIEKNRVTLLEEARFLQADRYIRIFGNHDLEWKYSIQQNLYLVPIFGEKLKVYEGVVLKANYKDTSYSIFLTHGHQGDKKSDGNAFSTWVVATLWTPIQRFLEISIDTVSDSFELVDKHNVMMYQWSLTQKDLVFISGHTHKPVFASLDHIDRLAKQLEKAAAANDTLKMKSLEKELEKRRVEYQGKKLVTTMAKPSYFNTGCCCFNDGDITGIEIEEGFIRIIKWENKDSVSTRKVLEESPLFYIFDHL